MAGGFLAGADRVVTTFHLPKKTMMSSPPRERTRRLEETREDEKGYPDNVREEPLVLRTYDLDEDLMDAEPTSASSSYLYEGREFVPKTMQQMAEDAAKELARDDDGGGGGGGETPSGQTRIDPTLREASSSSTTKSVTVEGRVTRSRSGAIKLHEKTKLGGPGPEALKTPRRGRGGGVRSSSSFGRWKGGGGDSDNKDRRKRRRVDSESEDEAEGSPDDGGEEEEEEEEGMDVVGDDDETYRVDLSEEDRRRSTRTPIKKRPRNGRTNKGH